MGGFQRAGMGKNKKVIENSPCYSEHFSLRGPKNENFKKYIYILSEMAYFDYDFGYEQLKY